jgi:hypothetical protein
MTLPQPQKKTASPDFRLILSVLEKKILKGEDADKCRKTLIMERVWKSLNPDMGLQWARLAQMAGEVETALAVLDHLNRTCPDMEAAWTERMETLAILGRHEERVRTAALHKQLRGSPLMEAAAPPCPAQAADPDMTAADAPFSDLRSRQDAVARFMRLFSGREDCFARQWADKAENKQGYVPVRHPMTPAEVEEHLAGRKTYGIYLLRSDATVLTAVIDADLKPEFRDRQLTAADKGKIRKEQDYLFSRIRELSGNRGVRPLVEFSGGKGYHFWYFFQSPVPAGQAKTLLESVQYPVAQDLSVFNLEVFPKQDHLSGKGLGNLVKLPLGIHRLSGKPSYFLECPDRSSPCQLAFLNTVIPAHTDSIRFDPPEFRPAVVPHPRMKDLAGSEHFKETGEISRLTAACPPFARAVNACVSGKDISLSEEKTIYQTIGFLPNARPLIHRLMSGVSGYNAHLTDYKLSQVRGTPLGCRRIHALMEYDGPLCDFNGKKGYGHPLMHLGWGDAKDHPKAETIVTLADALENLKLAIFQVERLLKDEGGN